VSLPTFVTDDPFTAPGSVTLGEEAAHHMRVRRIEVGSEVGLLDGVGMRGTGVLTHLAKRHATVSVDAVEQLEPPSAIHLLLPVADRDRMLLLAEKATELQVASWRPVLYRRSKHVNPRGEGPVFQQKARSRMRAALAQSRGAWLPTMFPDATVEHAAAAAAPGVQLVLEVGGATILEALMVAVHATWEQRSPLPAVTLAVGPEGGFEPDEFQAFTDSGFRAVSIGDATLRFETAAIAGVAAARAALDLARLPSPADLHDEMEPRGID
jgi:16S rRNA (uracil1498-N3)-methyltransferase